MTLTISGVVHDLGVAERSVSSGVEALDLDLELSHQEVLVRGDEVGVSVHISAGLWVRDGLVPPVQRIVRLERQNVAKLLSIEIPGLHRL